MNAEDRGAGASNATDPSADSLREIVAAAIEAAGMIEENVGRREKGFVNPAYSPEMFYQLADALRSARARAAADPAPAPAPGMAGVRADDLRMLIARSERGYSPPDEQAALRRLRAAVEAQG